MNRQELLLERIEIQARSAKDRRDKARTDTLHRLLKTALELTARRQLNDEIRERFVEALQGCEYGGESVVSFKDMPHNVVRIDGEFDLVELAKKLAW
jgi:hypothetical protein